MTLIKRKRNKISVLVQVLYFISFSHITIASPNMSESELKALYLFNFSNFVQWPMNCSEQECHSFNFCTTNNNEITSHLTNIIKGEKINKLPINILINPTPDQMHDCQVFYIDTNDEYQLPNLLNSFKDHPILTVSNIPNFTAKGGMIGFEYSKNRIAPTINNTIALSHKLKISSKLIKIAHEVR